MTFVVLAAFSAAGVRLAVSFLHMQAVMVIPTSILPAAIFDIRGFLYWCLPLDWRPKHNLKGSIDDSTIHGISRIEIATAAPRR